MKHLDDIRGQYHGSCTLVGNAPNLAVKRLPRYCIGMNLIARRFAVTNWRPYFYLCTDRFVLEHYHPEVQEAIAASVVAFIPHDVTSYKGDIFPLLPDAFEQEHGNTLSQALELAIHLGYTKIDIAGVDFYTGRRLHFYPKEIDPMAELPPDEMSNRRKELIRYHVGMMDYAESRGVELRYV